MQIYLVGGAVRDQLLNKPVSERDWVVVGATEEEMLKLGYQKVGRNFPVFLHPITHEEYALARTERKTGKGYTQFTCYAHPNVTLEEDLRRRDLTINAIAQTPDGKLIDPYGGLADLKNKTLRHVSEAFAEDPVRILRVARFAAKLSDFKIHPTTLQLMHQIIAADELNALTPERVWQELIRALAEPHPEKFFLTLNECGALVYLFPEIANTLSHLVPKLQAATLYTNNLLVRFAILMGQVEVSSIKSFCNRYRIPRAYNKLAIILARHLDTYRHILHADADTLLSLLEALDAFRQPQTLHLFILASTILISDKPLLNQPPASLPPQFAINDSPHATLIMQAYYVAQQIDIKKIIANEIHKDNLKERIRESRLTALHKYLNL